MLSKIDEYRRGLKHCTGKAAMSPSLEIRQLWATMARSYDFLLAREERLSAEDRERDARSIEARADR
jgi:hypothetical protein